MKTLIIKITFLLFPVLGFATNFKNGHPFFSNQDKSLARNLLLINFHGAPSRLSLTEQGYLQIFKEAISDGPRDMSTNDYQDRLFSLGAEIDASVSANVVSVILKAPPENFSKVLSLLRSTLDNLRISEADFKKYKERVLENTKASFEEMRTVTIYYATRNYVKDADQIKNGDSSPKLIEKLDFAGYAASIPKIVQFKHSFFSYIGPVDSVNVKAAIENEFKEGLRQKYVENKVLRTAVPKDFKTEIHIINKKGATDHQVFMIFPQEFKRESLDWQVGNINMDLLGGGLHSDLGKTLRSERGLTYGVASNMSSNLLPFWWVWSFAGSQHIKGLISGIPEVIAQFKNKKLSGEQIEDAKKRLRNSFLSNTETAKDRLLSKNWYIANGVAYSAYEKYLSRLGVVNSMQIEKFKSNLQSTKYHLYLMGDKDVLMPILSELGYDQKQIKIIEFTSLE